jgi:predicted NUDIX family phosphoesterase
MSVVATEKVLVVPTALFRDLGYFQGFSDQVAKYLPRLLEGDQIEYRPRGEMEQDPSFKQLIPYVLFRWTDDKGTAHLFEYQRGGGMGETRLHAKHSVGVGGHISSLDAAAGHTEHVYREGMRRELDEEVAIDTPYDETVVGLIKPRWARSTWESSICATCESRASSPAKTTSSTPASGPSTTSWADSTSSKAGRRSSFARFSARPPVSGQKQYAENAPPIA